MSADSQRLKSALRRIVLESPELRELLGDSDNRGDQAGSAGVGTSEAEESRLCCDGSTSDNANPGTEERDPDSSSQTGLDSDDPARLTSGDGTLSGVTDCATGEPICFDGSGFIPPDGWDEPQNAPYKEGYEEGYYWARNGSECPAPTPCDVYRCVEPDLLSCSFDSSTNTVTYTWLNSNGDEVGPVTDGVEKLACDGSPESYCNPTEDETREDTWPADSCVNLAIKNGTIVGSKYDPDQDGSYSAPMDEIQLCSGTEQIGLKPAANGGWKTINAATDSGYLWDSHGKKIAHIDGNEYSDPDV